MVGFIYYLILTEKHLLGAVTITITACPPLCAHMIRQVLITLVISPGTLPY